MFFTIMCYIIFAYNTLYRCFHSLCSNTIVIYYMFCTLHTFSLTSAYTAQASTFTHKRAILCAYTSTHKCLHI